MSRQEASSPWRTERSNSLLILKVFVVLYGISAIRLAIEFDDHERGNGFRSLLDIPSLSSKQDITHGAVAVPLIVGKPPKNVKETVSQTAPAAPVVPMMNSSVDFIRSLLSSKKERWSRNDVRWQSTERFLKDQKNTTTNMQQQQQEQQYGDVPLPKGQPVHKDKDDVRMTVDFLTFAVEHLSKWWEAMEVDRQRGTTEQAYQVMTETLLSYVHKHWHRHKNAKKVTMAPMVTMGPRNDSSSSSYSAAAAAMPQTVALMVFTPWKTKKSRVWSHTLSVCNLAASLLSLVRVGCGRVIVTTDVQFHRPTLLIMDGVFRLLTNPNKFQQEMHQKGDTTKTNGTVTANWRTNTQASITTSTRRAQLIQAQAKQLRLALETFFATHWKSASTQWDFVVGDTEITFRVVNCTQRNGIKKGKMGKSMIAKEGLATLKQAMLLSSSLLDPIRRNNHTFISSSEKGLERNDQSFAIQWLGQAEEEEHKWKYVYSTGADTILHVKGEALPTLARELDLGHVLIPHRLQPLPHESDFFFFSRSSSSSSSSGDDSVPKNVTTNSVIPSYGVFAHVQQMGSTDQCCDDGAHPNTDYNYDRVSSSSCNGTFWYLCGFGHNKNNKQDVVTLDDNREKDHIRLAPYGLFHLRNEGTGLVTFAGSQNGRRCIPQKATEKCYMSMVAVPR